MKKRLKDLFLVTLGALISAIGFNTMFLENNIASGGVGGLAISMNALFGWEPSTFVLLANIPLMALCFFLLGKETFLKTIYGAWIFPTFISLTAPLPTITTNPLLAALFGGIILGFGIGLVFQGNSSTGGIGILIQILNKYTPLPLGLLMALVDGGSVGIGFIAFDSDTVMYSIIALISITYVVNMMMAGADSSRNLMIISSKQEQIKEFITTVLDRGVTEFPIIGGYTGKESRLLMVTISRPEYPLIEAEIQKLDETAFVIVMPASQVRGRGFSLHKRHQVDDDILIPM